MFSELKAEVTDPVCESVCLGVCLKHLDVKNIFQINKPSASFIFQYPEFDGFYISSST